MNYEGHLHRSAGVKEVGQGCSTSLLLKAVPSDRIEFDGFAISGFGFIVTF